MKGNVKWFNNRKGYGFIKIKEDSDDIFIHYTNICDNGYKSLKEGQRVEFDLLKGDKGLQATNVIKI